MLSQYNDVVWRPLSDSERGVSSSEGDTPLVIEPLKSSSVSFLHEFLQSHSAQIRAALVRHGALLIRGFDVTSSRDFEQTILRIRGMSGMSELLLSEPGRTLADGTQFVFHTNSLVKTGGTTVFDDFHSENYFAPDVPRYVSFFCLTPSTLGGETGLINLRKLYVDLPESVKAMLEERACFVARYALADMECRYGLRTEAIEKFCAEVGLSALSVKARRYVAVYKPSVIRHPVTHDKVLLLNFLNIPGLRKALLREFLPDYRGHEWLKHRLTWRLPLIYGLVHPDGVLRTLYRRVLRGAAQKAGSKAYLLMDDARLAGSFFSASDVQLLARSMRHRYSSFLWKRGDVLILDNLQLAHAGMPGQGKRNLRVMLCNPVSLPYSEASAGLHRIDEVSETPMTLGARLLELSQRETPLSTAGGRSW